MFTAASIAILVALAMAVTRALKGPTVFDRVVAANSVGTLAILLLATVGFLNGRPEFLDIGIVYGLLNVIGTLAVLKFFRHGDLSHSGDEESTG
ncbi:MAG: monovalent cation/H+ antiporter complex subunit F [Methyloligellaceae bacterium]